MSIFLELKFSLESKSSLNKQRSFDAVSHCAYFILFSSLFQFCMSSEYLGSYSAYRCTNPVLLWNFLWSVLDLQVIIYEFPFRELKQAKNAVCTSKDSGTTSTRSSRAVGQRVNRSMSLSVIMWPVCLYSNVKLKWYTIYH